MAPDRQEDLVLKISLFDYDLPSEQIAQAPVSPRDASRLLCLGRDDRVTHHVFSDLADLLPDNALLVLNDTQVLRARLFGRKASGGRVELLLTEPGPEGWKALWKASHRPRPGEEILPETPGAEPIRVLGDAGERELLVALPGDGLAYLEHHGHLPLPPYIRRPDGPEDARRYQTVYAETPGAVAAPTAGLHFTQDLLARLQARGVKTTTLTLHVGIGTFAPVKVEDTDDHPMHAERFCIPEACAQAIAGHPADAPIVAVGTTVVRALESAALESATLDLAGREGQADQSGGAMDLAGREGQADQSGGAMDLAGREGQADLTGRQARQVRQGWQSTNLLIQPGFRFSIVDSLITNFHLPRSTLLLLVSALRSRESILAAYREAVSLKYRFFSYGDAMYLP
ncbi:MAG: tRNA preQ1(34) S-adenosylmethionine ribosyltransferase-isomerase QueA [Deltaproteobacteria bacterium HGW-Deltaproteobacteria-17]|nr:MAG: tRNA preQ1(34) S-adenosylmethionine ribosyltransferase-isomerase QueA [Deltaproteobacteria bacterium HGW-Deltaproteobacteria-17]